MRMRGPLILENFLRRVILYENRVHVGELFVLCRLLSILSAATLSRYVQLPFSSLPCQNKHIPGILPSNACILLC